VLAVTTPILIASLAAAIILMLVVAIHLVYLAMSRPAREDGAPMALLMFAAVGVAVLWVGIARLIVSGWITEDSGSALSVGAIALYLAATIVYVEIRSLLSRGYSLRIVIDLMTHGNELTIEHLKSSYGNGLGVVGILAKRLATLDELRLIRVNDSQVGPLTTPGHLLAGLGLSLRRLLKLETVG
jgi:hypothetical protein